MVEHMSAGEEKDQYQTNGGPEVPVLDDWNNEWIGNGDECADDKNSSNGNSPSHVVEWTYDRGLWAAIHMAGNPGMDLFSGLRSGIVSEWRNHTGDGASPVCEVISQRIGICDCMWPSGWLEEEKHGSCLEAKLQDISYAEYEVVCILTDWKVFFPSAKSNVP